MTIAELSPETLVSRDRAVAFESALRPTLDVATLYPVRHLEVLDLTARFLAVLGIAMGQLF